VAPALKGADSITQGEQIMKLANVYMARAAMNQLVQAKLSPKVAYRVLKFAKKFEVEFGIVDAQRVALLREVSGAKEGKDAKIEPNTPEMATFVQEFNPILDTDSDMEVCPLKFDVLLEALDAEEGNKLSASDLAILEPLFESDEAASDIKVLDKPDGK